jgi:uncharacterized glyoxalase superfamily protein PhnB
MGTLKYMLHLEPEAYDPSLLWEQGDPPTNTVLNAIGKEDWKKYGQSEYMFGGMDDSPYNDPGGYGKWGEEEDPEVVTSYARRMWGPYEDEDEDEDEDEELYETESSADGTQNHTVYAQFGTHGNQIGSQPAGSLSPVYPGGGQPPPSPTPAAEQSRRNLVYPGGGQPPPSLRPFAPSPVDVAAQNLYAAQANLVTQPPTQINYTETYPKDYSRNTTSVAPPVNTPIDTSVSSMPDYLYQHGQTPTGYRPGIDPQRTYNFPDPPPSTVTPYGAVGEVTEVSVPQVLYERLPEQAGGGLRYKVGGDYYSTLVEAEAAQASAGGVENYIPEIPIAPPPGQKGGSSTVSLADMEGFSKAMGVGLPTRDSGMGGPERYAQGVQAAYQEALRERERRIGEGGAAEGTRGQTVGNAIYMRGGGMPRRAQELAARGRGGDTTLVHMNPEEMTGIASLFPEKTISRNPDTGLPEMFSFQQALPMIAGIGSMFIPGLQPWGAALISGAATAIAEEDIGKGVMAGLMSYGMGSLLSTGASSATKATQAAKDAAVAQAAAETTTQAVMAPAAVDFTGGFDAASQSGMLGAGTSNIPSYVTQGNAAIAADSALPAHIFQGSGGAYPAMSEAEKFASSQAVQDGAATGAITPSAMQSEMLAGGSSAGAYGAVYPQASGGWRMADYDGVIGPSYSPKVYTETTGAPWPGPVSGEKGMDAAMQPIAATAPPPDASGVAPELGGTPRDPNIITTYEQALEAQEAQRRLQADLPGYYNYEAPVMGAESVSTHPIKPEPKFEPLATRVDTSEGILSVPEGSLAEHYPELSDTISDRLYGNIEKVPDGQGGYLTEAEARKAGYIDFSDVASDAMYAGMGLYGTAAPMFEEEYEFPERQKPTYAPTRQIDASEYKTATAPPPGYDPATEGEWSYYGAEGGIASNLPVIYAATGYGKNEQRREEPPPPRLISREVAQLAMGQIAGTQMPPSQRSQRKEPQRPTAETLGRFMPSGGMPRQYAQWGTEGAVVEEMEEAVRVRPDEVSVAGIMEGAPEIVREDVANQAMLTPLQSEPQNSEERAIYNNAILALEGELEPADAQNAIEEYIEVFGAEAYRTLKDFVSRDRDTGGVVKPANGETTVADGEVQGEDVMAGKIVNPVTGEETANLRVAENEYIKTGDALARQAERAGLPATPENGAMIEGMEEEALRRAYG